MPLCHSRPTIDGDGSIPAALRMSGAAGISAATGRNHFHGRAIVNVAVALALAALLSVPVAAAAQESHHGHGHDRWHAEFYSKLMRPDTKTSCCNLADCRPTEVRTVGDHYEVMKDGCWIRVPPDKILKITAPDGGAHLCAPASEGTSFEPDFVFCIVMPLET